MERNQEGRGEGRGEGGRRGEVGVGGKGSGIRVLFCD